ncbi:hypothetical protein Cni_G01090 [Canna indica]|uniref:WRKY domain-containing protein n=1 Tax=Canna indica TaxID=4628 RepID=A0AAQ3JNY1_9LILI|nr:hypothetical protein Cni_G01090 [Canna indica]
MEGNLEPSPGDLGGGATEVVSPPPELRVECCGARNDGYKREDMLGKEGRTDPGVSVLPGANGARYKTMSPARLPIARPPCVTIPPGFSPSALLESPVLLTNMKIVLIVWVLWCQKPSLPFTEPSPTTGTLNTSLIMDKAVHSITLFSPKDTSTVNADCGESSEDFDFKPHVGASYNIGLSPLKPLGSVGLMQEDRESSMQIQRQPKSRDEVTSKDDSTPAVSAPNLVTEASNLTATLPFEAVSDELHQKIDLCQSDCIENTNSIVPEKSAEDGYNWRKYGQKYVKGSEYPRSYYKCTHPNCEMKKQFERSHDGQITGIIYKGCHDHPKPQPNRRIAIGAILTNQEGEKTDNFSSSMSVEDESAIAPGHISHQIEPIDTAELSPASISGNDVEIEIGGGLSNNCDEVAEDGDLESKRRKIEITVNDVAAVGKMNREPRVVVQTVSEVDILDDGYRWRKYGQKVVKGNPNPRSYYKCTTAGCPVRKHVERASHDPKAVITTYEGKHNHDVPAAKPTSHESSSSMVADGDSSLAAHSPAALCGIMRPFPHLFTQTQSDTISLDLGVGIRPNHNDFTYQKQHSRGTDHIQQHQLQHINCGKMVIQATPLSRFYGTSHTPIYGPGEDKGEGFTFKAAPINTSSDMYQTTTGNLVMGP